MNEPSLGAGAAKALSSSELMLGRYELVHQLAAGGMAEIFLARAVGIEGFERLVVLKRILPGYARDSRFVRMFLEEARIAATLHHANIGQVYDIGKTGDTYFFTMEFVHGPSVQQLLEKARWLGKPVPIEHAVSIVMGAAAGLHYAHERHGRDGKPLDIVHRDVSPPNILVDYEGGVKLVDFGIAKARTSRTHTEAGAIKGKIPYMSPEQCLGKPVDRRTDIYSLGVVLYELTTGSYLFSEESDELLMKRIAEGDIASPDSRVPDYPAAVQEIVLRALSKDREQRFATARDLLVELDSYARNERFRVPALGLSDYLKELFPEQGIKEGPVGRAVKTHVDAFTSTRVKDAIPQPMPVLTTQPVPSLMSRKPGRGILVGFLVGAAGALLFFVAMRREAPRAPVAAPVEASPPPPTALPPSPALTPPPVPAVPTPSMAATPKATGSLSETAGQPESPDPTAEAEREIKPPHGAKTKPTSISSIVRKRRMTPTRKAPKNPNPASETSPASESDEPAPSLQELRKGQPVDPY